MKQVIIVFLLPFLLPACTSVKFAGAQPKDTEELKAFPPGLSGMYVNSDKDTLTISGNSFEYGHKKTTDFYMNGKVPSSKSVLKKLNDFYILSVKDQSNWEVISFKYTDKKIDVYYISLNENKEAIIKKLKETLDVKEIKDADGSLDYYLVNPSRKEFEALLQDDVFSKVTEFTRIR